MCVRSVEKRKYEGMTGKCRSFAWLPAGLATTIKDKYNMKMYRGHDLWRLIEAERTTVWCEMCAGHAEHKLGDVQDKTGHRKTRRGKIYEIRCI